MSQLCLFWFGIRLLFFSNFIYLSVALTIAFLVIFDFEIDYTSAGLALTYSVLVASAFVDTINFFSGTE